MFSSNFHNSSWLKCSSNREELKEDSVEALGTVAEALVEEVDEVRNPFSVIHVGYSGTIRENVLMHSLLTMQPVIITSKIVLS